MACENRYIVYYFLLYKMYKYNITCRQSTDNIMINFFLLRENVVEFYIDVGGGIYGISLNTNGQHS